jgi:hypothetical protein
MSKAKSVSNSPSQLSPPLIGGVAVVRRGRQRDVAFAGQQAGGGIQPDPAGAGQVDLGPACRSVKSWSVPAGPSSDTRSGSWIR